MFTFSRSWSRRGSYRWLPDLDPNLLVNTYTWVWSGGPKVMLKLDKSEEKGSWTIPATGASNGMAGGADLVLTKAWRPPLQCRQWSFHCLGDTNTCGIRYGSCRWRWRLRWARCSPTPAVFCAHRWWPTGYSNASNAVLVHLIFISYPTISKEQWCKEAQVQERLFEGGRQEGVEYFYCSYNWEPLAHLCQCSAQTLMKQVSISQFNLKVKACKVQKSKSQNWKVQAGFEVH